MPENNINIPFTPDDVRQEIFYPCIDKLESGIIVEVGILVCGNLCRVAQYAKEKNKNIKFYGVDNFSFIFNKDNPLLTYHGNENAKPNLESFEICINNINEANLFSHIRLITAESINPNTLFDDETIDLVFLDTIHTYEQTKKEILIWERKVKNGGIFAGHDWQEIGVSEAIKEFFPSNKINLVSNNTAFWIKK